MSRPQVIAALVVVIVFWVAAWRASLWVERPAAKRRRRAQRKDAP